MGYQEAKNGDAYVGIGYRYTEVLSTENPVPGHHSEYIFTELTESLQAGEIYTFSMYVSKAELLTYSANQFGAAFVSTLPFAGGNITTHTISVTPQVLGMKVISDETNWTKIEGTFTADGGEQYVIIGHFPDPETLEVEQNGVIIDYTDIFQTYYYIDDVSLTKGNLSTPVIQEQEIRVYPNPADSYVLIEGISSENIKKAAVFDVNGKKITTSFHNNKVDISSLSAGIYILKIETEEGTVLEEKIIKK